MVVAACSRGHPFEPDNQPEFSNDTNLFRWQAVAMDNNTEILNYTWETTGAWAVIEQIPEFTSGTALLRIWDATGRPVYARDLDEFGTYTTNVGYAGSWTVEVRVSGASGAVRFTITSTPSQKFDDVLSCGDRGFLGLRGLLRGLGAKGPS
jgi:hypothetical protein